MINYFAIKKIYAAQCGDCSPCAPPLRSVRLSVEPPPPDAPEALLLLEAAAAAEAMVPIASADVPAEAADAERWRFFPVTRVVRVKLIF